MNFALGQKWTEAMHGLWGRPTIGLRGMTVVHHLQKPSQHFVWRWGQITVVDQ